MGYCGGIWVGEGGVRREGRGGGFTTVQAESKLGTFYHIQRGPIEGVCVCICLCVCVCVCVWCVCMCVCVCVSCVAIENTGTVVCILLSISCMV